MVCLPSEHLPYVLPSLCFSKVKNESPNSALVRKALKGKKFESYLHLPANWLLPMQQQLIDTIRKIVPLEKMISSSLVTWVICYF